MDVPSDLFPYACERCDNFVMLTTREYASRKKGRGKYGAQILCESCSTVAVEPPAVEEPDPPRPRRRKPPPRSSMFVPEGATKGISLTPKERDDYGVTLTIREQTTHQLHTFSVRGSLVKSLAEACDLIDQIREGEWKIVSISNPISIFRDLQGSHDPGVPNAEAQKLGRIGRRDLLEVIPYGEKRPM